jgi:hypothetical protein
MLANYYPKMPPMSQEEAEKIINKENKCIAGSLPPNLNDNRLALKARAMTDLYQQAESALVNTKEVFTKNILEAAKNGRRGVRLTIFDKEDATGILTDNKNKLHQWFVDEGFNVSKVENTLWEVTW